MASALALLSSNPWCHRAVTPSSPSQFSSWGCLMSLRRVSPNGSFIVTAAGNGSWEAVDGSSLLLPPLANALFYQPRDERTAAPRPSVRTLFFCGTQAVVMQTGYQRAASAPRLFKSILCSANTNSYSHWHALSLLKRTTNMRMINVHAIFFLLVTFVCLFWHLFFSFSWFLFRTCYPHFRMLVVC